MVEPLNYPDWAGRTVFIIGGGPSVRFVDSSLLSSHPVIAINEAGLTFLPDAPVLFWGDMRWVMWNEDRICLHHGTWRFTTQFYGSQRIPRAQLLSSDGLVAFDERPGHVAGADSGAKAINLAFHTGARRVVLLGFDMHDTPADRWRDGYWHDRHKEPPIQGQRMRDFIPAHNRMAAYIRDQGLDFEVVNATPGSALTCWPGVRFMDRLP